MNGPGCRGRRRGAELEDEFAAAKSPGSGFLSKPGTPQKGVECGSGWGRKTSGASPFGWRSALNLCRLAFLKKRIGNMHFVFTQHTSILPQP